MKHKTLDMRDNLELCKFIENLSKKFPYKDTFTANTAINVPVHTHDDYEARLFLEGSAVFTVDGKVCKCAPGSYIEIAPGVQHSFEYDGVYPLKVLRFFSKNNGWIANFCPE
jgi:cupin superfamily acireductone dioxygenase involved in methionine salvage